MGNFKRRDLCGKTETYGKGTDSMAATQAHRPDPSHPIRQTSRHHGSQGFPFHSLMDEFVPQPIDLALK